MTDLAYMSTVLGSVTLLIVFRCVLPWLLRDDVTTGGVPSDVRPRSKRGSSAHFGRVPPRLLRRDEP